MLHTLNWLSVEQGIEKDNLVLIHKIEHDKLPRYLNDFLEKRLNFYDYNIRSRQNYNIQSVKTATLQKSLFYEGVRLYNALPKVVKSASSVHSFSRDVHKYLLEANVTNR